jgi:hypothetical protein
MKSVDQKRKLFIGGNWKLNGSLELVKKFSTTLLPQLPNPTQSGDAVPA